MELSMILKLTVPDKGAKRPQLAYSIPGLAKDTTLSKSLLYEHIKRGLLKTVKCGRRTLVLHDEAVRWLSTLS